MDAIMVPDMPPSVLFQLNVTGASGAPATDNCPPPMPVVVQAAKASTSVASNPYKVDCRDILILLWREKPAYPLEPANPGRFPCKQLTFTL
jgi:hypothetical protein